MITASANGSARSSSTSLRPAASRITSRAASNTTNGTSWRLWSGYCAYSGSGPQRSSFMNGRIRPVAPNAHDCSWTPERRRRPDGKTTPGARSCRRPSATGCHSALRLARRRLVCRLVMMVVALLPGGERLEQDSETCADRKEAGHGRGRAEDDCATGCLRGGYGAPSSLSHLSSASTSISTW
jgi:hypothetical protein